jgi:hypothetical protein
MIRRAARLAGLTLALLWGAWTAAPAARATLPDRLSDKEFWTLVQDFSEPNGFFRSDNLVSNEDTLQVVVSGLQKTVKPGSAYLGVGPDQNFTLINAVQPKIAFITDIRRGNLDEHLLYKALFEISPDRATFLSHLFSRARPADVREGMAAGELFVAYDRVAPTRALYEQTLGAVLDRLTTTHGFTLTDEDKATIGVVLSSFYDGGPSLAYAMTNGRSPRYPTFAELQTIGDWHGQNYAPMGSEAMYLATKSFEARNLLVPVVGDFAGPRALRAVGTFLKAHDLTVGVFYLSNVEQYLFQDGLWPAFEKNVETLPLDEASTFVRSCFSGCASTYPSRAVMLTDSIASLVQDTKEGRIRGYLDVLGRSR